jgi:hypothetical protein
MESDIVPESSRQRYRDHRDGAEKTKKRRREERDGADDGGSSKKHKHSSGKHRSSRSKGKRRRDDDDEQSGIKIVDASDDEHVWIEKNIDEDGQRVNSLRRTIRHEANCMWEGFGD